MGQSRPLFCLFSSFSHHKSITNWKSVDGVLGIRTWGRRMLGADETTELWRPPNATHFFKYGPIPASFLFIFILFTSQINYKLKKRRWSAGDSNLGPQDVRRRWNHGAMAATQRHSFVCDVLAWTAFIYNKTRSKKITPQKRITCS